MSNFADVGLKFALGATVCGVATHCVSPILNILGINIASILPYLMIAIAGVGGVVTVVLLDGINLIKDNDKGDVAARFVSPLGQFTDESDLSAAKAEVEQTMLKAFDALKSSHKASEISEFTLQGASLAVTIIPNKNENEVSAKREDQPQAKKSRVGRK